MKKVALLAASVITIFAANQSANGQDEYWNMMYQQAAQHEQMNQMWMNLYQQRQSQINDLYRQETGDYTSSDAEVQAKLDAMSRRAYPQAYAQMHQNMMQSNAQTFNNMQNSFRQYSADVNAMYQSSNDYASATNSWVSDRWGEYFRDEQRYVNPTTGQIQTLPTYNPNTAYQNAYGNNYYQNSYGQYYQVGPDGYGTQMNVYRGW